MATTETEGYVGRIVVTRAQKTVHEPAFRNGHAQERQVDRHVTEILDVTVRADSEGEVRLKLEQALQLLDSGLKPAPGTQLENGRLA